MQILDYPPMSAELITDVIKRSYSEHINHPVSTGYVIGLLNKYPLPYPYPKGLFEKLITLGCKITTLEDTQE